MKDLLVVCRDLNRSIEDRRFLRMNLMYHFEVQVLKPIPINHFINPATGRFYTTKHICDNPIMGDTVVRLEREKYDELRMYVPWDVLPPSKQLLPDKAMSILDEIQRESNKMTAAQVRVRIIESFPWLTAWYFFHMCGDSYSIDHTILMIRRFGGALAPIGAPSSDKPSVLKGMVSRVLWKKKLLSTHFLYQLLIMSTVVAAASGAAFVLGYQYGHSESMQHMDGIIRSIVEGMKNNSFRVDERGNYVINGFVVPEEWVNIIRRYVLEVTSLPSIQW